jgi:hypothetical protein
VREAKYDRFDIGKVLERLLLKGSIVVKKAYCDWDRYKEFKAPMHGASFELIEIPHLRQSGKNSADIRMVVDALDLCYTKSHVDTFVIVSGDSDFSPLVSKLRENDKTVIGVGVKKSTSDLLVAACDEFIYYDDLVREQKPRRAAKPKAAPARKEGGPRRRPGPDAAAPASSEAANDAGATEPTDKQQEALDLVISTLDALVAERGETRPSGARWSSRRSSGAAPASTRSTTASDRSTSCSRRRRRAASCPSSAMPRAAATSSGRRTTSR